VLAYARCPVLTLREQSVKKDEDSVIRVAAHT